MKTVTGLSLAILLLLAPSAASQIPDDKLVVPGQRVGKWTLEMTLTDLLVMNGPRQPLATNPYREDDVAAVDLWTHSWDHLGVRAATKGPGGPKVELLGSIREEFKTDKGMGPTATRGTVEAAYGSPTATTRWGGQNVRLIYDEIGLAFRLNSNLVAAVLIFRPGSAKQYWKY